MRYGHRHRSDLLRRTIFQDRLRHSQDRASGARYALRLLGLLGQERVLRVVNAPIILDVLLLLLHLLSVVLNQRCLLLLLLLRRRFYSLSRRGKLLDCLATQAPLLLLQ